MGRLRPMLLAAGLVLAACGGSADRPATLAGTVREPAPDVAAVSLPDASTGGTLAMRGPDNGLLVMYFGFTSCPDVCPTTMSDLRAALRDLDEAERERVEVAMATIDPGRDSGDTLTRYVQTFAPGGHALRTDDADELRGAADAFGADYSVTAKPGGEPEVSHTAWLYAVDDRGRLRVQWPFGTPSDDIANDLSILLSDTEETS